LTLSTVNLLFQIKLYKMRRVNKIYIFSTITFIHINIDGLMQAVPNVHKAFLIFQKIVTFYNSYSINY